MEQQYTCPECKQDYTRFTIHEHYECGVEPLESLDDLNEEGKIGNPEAESKAPETEAIGVTTKQEPDVAPQPVAPKKRGPKPKAK